MPLDKNIFDADSDDDGCDFRINNAYASRYDDWRCKEEYEKARARFSVLEQAKAFDDSSSSEEDDTGKDYGKADNPEFDQEFLLTLGTIYKHEKDEGDVKDLKFFTGDYRVEKEKEEKPMTLKDYERHVMMERGGKFEEDEADAKDIKSFSTNSKREVFDDGLQDEEEDDDDGDGLLTSGLFKPKEDSKKEAKTDADEAPRNAAIDYVKGISKNVADSQQQDILDTLKDKWSSNKLTKKDKWLQDFFLNQRYLAENSDDEEYDPNFLLEEEELSDDDEKEGTVNPFATQYKFRHQEPGEFLKRHPRSVPDSLRPKDEKRKEQRIAAKERQLQKKEEKRREIELLKAIKYKEIQEKISKIQQASGNFDIDLGEADLENDFDPDAHDAYMQKMLGGDYYDDCNAEADLPDFADELDDAKYYDTWVQPGTSKEEASFKEEEEAEEDFDYGEDYEEECYNDVENESENVPKVKEKRPPKSSTRRKGRHQSTFSRSLEKEKPVFDPQEKDFQSYFDEYYKLDFEDVIGGIPCRFRYRKVEANDFGLTTGEILAAQNADLNRWIGLKKIMQHNRTWELEDYERRSFADKAKLPHLKMRLLPSLFNEDPEEMAEKEREKRRLKNLKKKQKKWRMREGIEEGTAAPDGGHVEENNTTERDPKSNQQSIADGETPSSTVENTEMNGQSSDITPKKKKKKKKQTEFSENEESTTESPKKKKKRDKHSEEQTESHQNGEQTNESPKKKKKREQTEFLENEQSTDESPKKKKKKIKQQEEQTESHQNGEQTNKSPKKKKEREQTEFCENGESTDERPKKRKTKQKRQKEEMESIQNGSPKEKKEREQTEFGEDEASTTESPKKKKQKQQEEQVESSQNGDKADESPRKKKKKKQTESFENEENTDGSPEKKERRERECIESNPDKMFEKRKQEACVGESPSGEAPQGSPKTEKKHKKTRMLQTTLSEDSPSQSVEGNKLSRRQKKNKKKKGLVPKISAIVNPIKKRKSKKGKKNEGLAKASKMAKKEGLGKASKMAEYFKGISNVRLEAYGQNPKKIKNRVLYGDDL